MERLSSEPRFFSITMRSLARTRRCGCAHVPLDSRTMPPMGRRIVEFFYFALAVLGVLGLASAVYFVWSGVAWYKVGALVGCSVLTLVSTRIGLNRIGERRALD